MGDTKDTVHSSHTFVLPFMLDSTGNVPQKFLKHIKNSAEWQARDISLSQQSGKLDWEKISDDKDERLLFYKEYMYFYPFVRKALYGMNSGIVSIYTYKPEKIKTDDTAGYIISKNGEDYTLNLKSIDLRIYNTGVILLAINCENRNYESLDDIKKINDYGRRIMLPFIPKRESMSADAQEKRTDGESICADSLEIRIGGESYKTDNAAYIAEICGNPGATPDVTRIADFIYKLLGIEENNSDTKKKSFEITPLVDDRMFVASQILNADAIKRYLGAFL